MSLVQPSTSVTIPPKFTVFDKGLKFTLCSENLRWSLDSSVGIATCYRLQGPGIESRWEARFSASVQTGHGAHPASYSIGTGCFPSVKRPWRGFDHPPNLAPRLRKE